MSDHVAHGVDLYFDDGVVVLIYIPEISAAVRRLSH